jgi:hypothetical protein
MIMRKMMVMRRKRHRGLSLRQYHGHGSTPLIMTGIACFTIDKRDDVPVTLSGVEGRHRRIGFKAGFFRYFT